MPAGARLSDLIPLGVLASSLPREAVDEAIAVTGRQAKRSDGKLSPHVMVYFVMPLALYAEEDYEEVAARLSEALQEWGCWEQAWTVATSGGLAVDGHRRVRVGRPRHPGQGGQRGDVRVRRVGCEPVGVPEGAGVTISECGSHAVVDAEMGGKAGKGSGDQTPG